MHERKSAGRPPVPEEHRSRPYSISLRPNAIETLKRMSRTQRKSMGELVDGAIHEAWRRQQSVILTGTGSLHEALKRWFGEVACGTGDTVPGSWFYEIGGPGKQFVYATPSALFAIGRVGKNAAYILDTHYQFRLIELLIENRVVWIDGSTPAEAGVTGEPALILQTTPPEDE
jgi:hypothetical protein